MDLFIGDYIATHMKHIYTVPRNTRTEKRALNVCLHKCVVDKGKIMKARRIRVKMIGEEQSDQVLSVEQLVQAIFFFIFIQNFFRVAGSLISMVVDHFTSHNAHMYERSLPHSVPFTRLATRSLLPNLDVRSGVALRPPLCALLYTHTHKYTPIFKWQSK